MGGFEAAIPMALSAAQTAAPLFIGDDKNQMAQMSQPPGMGGVKLPPGMATMPGQPDMQGQMAMQALLQIMGQLTQGMGQPGQPGQQPSPPPLPPPQRMPQPMPYGNQIPLGPNRSFGR